MVNYLSIALLAGVLLFQALAAGVIEPRVVPGSFLFLAQGGGAYPLVSGAGVINTGGPPEIRGTVTLDLWWRWQYDDHALNKTDTSLTIIYTLDGQPISPRRTSPYTFDLDTTKISDGGHVLAEIIVDGAGDITSDVPLATAIIVNNAAGPLMGPQRIPSLGNSWFRTTEETAIPEWISWPGGYVRQHPVQTAPYPAPISPPVYALPTPINWTFEPLTQTNISLEETSLQISRTKVGNLFVEEIVPEAAANADDSLQHVLATPMLDGPRNDNGISPYSTYVPNPTDRGFVGVDLGGRVFKVNMDGSVATIAGRQVKRDVVPYSSVDPRVTEADRRALQINMIGNFNGLELNQPNDLAFDPRSNGKTLYVADTENYRIAKIDFSAKPPNITTYGPLFAGPASLVVDADGVVYVADYDANTISFITSDGKTARILAGAAQGLNKPFSMRFDSKGNLVFAELSTGNVKSLNPATGVVTTIASALCGAGWTWLDVDSRGNVGPKDSIYLVCSTGGDNRGVVIISSDGSQVAVAPFARPHYPWAIVISDKESRLLLHGFGDSAPESIRPSLPTDKAYSWPYLYSDIWPIANRIQDAIDKWGTLPEFPSGAHPAAAALRTQGYSSLGLVSSYDDLALLTPAQIGAYIQGGLGGSSPRPEFTGRDLQLAVERIQINSALFPNRLFPSLPAAPTDLTPPVISNVQVALIDGTTAKVTWDTDKPSLGYARFGPATTYHRWSNVEAAFGTSHSVTLSYMPESKLMHFAIVTEDQSSNMTMTPDHTVQSGAIGPNQSPPPPPVPAPVATLSTLLSWNCKNANVSQGTGFNTAGALQGIAPVPSGTYSFVCIGVGGTSPPVSVTVK